MGSMQRGALPLQARVRLSVFVGVTALVMLAMVEAAPPAAAKVCDGIGVACAIGDTGPGGGIVFYDAGATQPWGRYLEAAPAGWMDNPNSPPPTLSTKSPAPSEPTIPGAPREVKVAVRQAGVMVTWKAPKSPEEGLTYRVTSTPPSTGCETKKRSCSIAGLSPGRTYVFSVTAENQVGEGDPSNPVSARIPARRRPAPQPTPKPTPSYRSLPLASPDREAIWCVKGAPGYAVFLRTATAIGAGKSNTATIVSACGAETAAGLASTYYRGGGKADWFLPSKDELNALYQQRGLVGGFAGDALWSSSQNEGNAVFAWSQSFTFGYQIVDYKSMNFRVRPVRAF